MSATRRLFGIIQTLRAASRPVTAAQLAGEQGVSLRTIYRDIAELQAQRVPIAGEAGIGYVLRQGYDLPPLMLTPNELEAALLGAQWVAARGDSALAQGANTLIAKLENVVPAHLRSILSAAVVTAPVWQPVMSDSVDGESLRESMRQRRKLRITYTDGAGRASERVIWPFMLAYFETVRLLVAWCEKREDFRHFRTDRICECVVLDERYGTSTRALKAAWWEKERQRLSFADGALE